MECPLHFLCPAKGRGEPPQGMQHGATLRHENARFYRGDAPPIFFLRHQKENAPCTVEKKNVRDELTALSVNSPKTEVGRHALPTKLETHLPAALYSNLKSVRPPHQKVLRTQVLQIGRPLLLFPLSLPRLSLGGIFKGESTKAPPGADKAARFRGNGTIGGPSGPGIVSP